jgi:nucleotide-binding universal stress UspA family protein
VPPHDPAENAVTQTATLTQADRIVVVVAIDLSDVSEHLLQTARDYVRPYREADIHIVYVVPREPSSRRLAELTRTVDLEHLAQIESARRELNRLCETIMKGSSARVFIHTPTGEVPEELAHNARTLGADVVLVEAHRKPRSDTAKSTMAQIKSCAPCSVVVVPRHRHAVEA